MDLSLYDCIYLVNKKKFICINSTYIYFASAFTSFSNGQPSLILNPNSYDCIIIQFL